MPQRSTANQTLPRISGADLPQPWDRQPHVPAAAVLPYSPAADGAVSCSGTVVASDSASSQAGVVAASAIIKRRADEPVLAPAKRANRDLACSAAMNSESQADALAAYERDKCAASSARPLDSLYNTWSDFHRRWFGSDDVLPLTPGKIAAVAAMFKQGRYRSYPNYLSRLKMLHMMQHSWSDSLEVEARQSARSVLRGIGPPRQTAEKI